MSALQITHTRETGTVIDGTSKNDGTTDILKANRWRWSPILSQWYIPYTRDKASRGYQIADTAKALNAAGHEVTVTVDDAPRPVHLVEADKAERQQDRAERLAARAERAAETATAAQDRADQAGRNLPPAGEPIKIGHHSERRHRRDVNRARNTALTSIDAAQRAAAAAAAAETASQATDGRYSPASVAQRVIQLETDLRGLERSRDGHTRTVDKERGLTETTRAATGEYLERLTVEITEVNDQIAYWSSVRDQQQADGLATSYGPKTVRKGDLVMIGTQWRLVVRANTKSVTVRTIRSFTDRAPWHKVQDHKPANQTADQSAT